MGRIVPLLERRLGAPLPGVVERHEVVDRAGWARANMVTFKQLVGRLEEHCSSARRSAADGPAPALAAIANRFLATQQIGFLLELPRRPRAGPVRRGAALRRGARRGGCSSSRRTSARRRRRWTCRWTTSASGSRCTRRRTPSSWRHIPGCGRTSRNGSSARSRSFLDEAKTSRRRACGSWPSAGARPRAASAASRAS